jgi:FkbM family methyltransferase
LSGLLNTNQQQLHELQSMVKKSLKKLFRKLGFEVKRYNLNTSQVALMETLLKYHHIDLIFDVGANCGQYASFLRDFGYEGKIVSFEPLSSAYSQLLTLSKKDNLWEIAPRSALGDQEGEITINIAGNSQSSSVLSMLDSHLQAAPESAYCGSEIVQLRRLDTLAKDYITKDTKSIFLKIDVQGFEKQVIEGAFQILPLVKGIQIEMSLVPLYDKQVLFEDMLEFMRQIGYELYTVIPNFADQKTGRLLQIDGIFFES